MTLDPKLVEYATTDLQREAIQAVLQYGGVRKAAKVLGISHSNVGRRIDRVKAQASVQGFAPGFAGWSRPVPATHVAKGVSVYHPAVTVGTGEDKRVVEPAAWVKADLRQEMYNEMVRGAIVAFIKEQPQLETQEARTLDYSADVIPWIQVGDAHIGLLAHSAEVGENFDLKIGERELCGAIGLLIDEMPACERAVLNDLGDFTHYENYTGTTEASGHALDYDGRFPKMIKAYARIMRFIIEKALTKVKVLDVIINQGNHSRTNDIWMAVMLKALYEGDPRVNVLDNDSVFIGYRMGKTFVMVHHSDKCKPAKLPSVMTADFRRDFGETDYHYIDIGHVHHSSVSQDIDGIVVESWNHLAASDKWAHENGYRSSKSISVVLRSKTYGEIGRRTLPIAEVRDRLYGAGHATALKTAAFVAH